VPDEALPLYPIQPLEIELVRGDATLDEYLVATPAVLFCPVHRHVSEAKEFFWGGILFTDHDSDARRNFREDAVT
jgi:hypothetical protein